ncbi:hypothetical protein MTR_3g450490 [Medicago truncatula]|uniref:Uncharacterized protein n=1 Tax=Medicago truncatula TaxID=3880 RepID=A0A072UUZ3_MEDTR|nr:hypothetical protein MTR_3g450490 [Medicago truncatula]
MAECIISDSWVWKWDTSGGFSVKSAYVHLSRDLSERSPNHQCLVAALARVWKSRAPLKYGGIEQICDTKVPLKLKRKFYLTAERPVTLKFYPSKSNFVLALQVIASVDKEIVNQNLGFLRSGAGRDISVFRLSKNSPSTKWQSHYKFTHTSGGSGVRTSVMASGLTISAFYQLS